MQNQSPHPNKIFDKLLKVPYNFGESYDYVLPDSSYGEWIIFEDTEPKYYFNAFDKQYSKVLDRIKQSGDAESYLTKVFKSKGLNLSMKKSIFGIQRSSKPEIVELTMEKLPLEYLI